jgi:hypothetical protein
MKIEINGFFEFVFIESGTKQRCGAEISSFLQIVSPLSMTQNNFKFPHIISERSLKLRRIAMQKRGPKHKRRSERFLHHISIFSLPWTSKQNVGEMVGYQLWRCWMRWNFTSFKVVFWINVDFFSSLTICILITLCLLSLMQNHLWPNKPSWWLEMMTLFR